ncbi:glucose-methanol-choline oxidoreductase [Hirudovirus strain Sangsue]|nr:glucose-methanol-choline oxidoreductase [Hirudovirus strain Sangsue]
MNPTKLFLVFVAFAFAIINALPVCRQGTFDPDYNGIPDYIIVGSGPGGSRAVQQCIAKGHKCTLVERGYDYFEVPYVQTPSASFLVYSSPAVRYASTVSAKNLFNLTVNAIEANVVGGASSINGLIVVITDIDNFYRELNITGWSYEELLPRYLELMTSLNRPEHTGPLDVSDTPVSDPAYQAYRNAIRQVFPNIPERLPDMNTAFANQNGTNFPGFGPPETSTKTTYMNFAGANVPIVSYRESAYMAFVHPIRNHPNFRLMTRSRVDKVVFDVCKTRARKVIVTATNYFGSQYQCELTARYGIVLAAGAIRTPQILLQSGIGPANELSALGISVVKNLTDVGRHLDDHPTIVRQYIGPIPDNYYSANINGHAYWNYQDNASVIPNWAMQIAGVPGINLKTVLSVLQNQKSRGSVKLRSANPDDELLIDLGHLNDISDLKTAANGFNKTNQVVNNLNYLELPGYSTVVCPPSMPNCYNNMTEFYLASYLQFASSGYHYTGTCALGKVVDPNTGLVYGFENLYVTDASVVPKTPRGNTQATTYVVSGKLSEKIF